MSLPATWGVSDEEAGSRLPGDELAGEGWARLLRGVDCAAPPERLWTWLGQLRVAPYSYDLLDNLGRRSPRTLTPGLGPLAVGQRIHPVFEVAGLVPGRDLTIRGRPGGVMADVVLGYAVRPAPAGSRLLGVVRHPRHPRPVDALLAWGDLVMMRKQLTTLATLATSAAGE